LGVPENMTEAAKWYLASARQNVKEAQYAVGMLYADGEGVPADLVEAYHWIALAAAGGHADAATFKPVLEKKLTPDQRAKARQIVASALAAQK
jgi:TPR repeat protein